MRRIAAAVHEPYGHAYVGNGDVKELQVNDAALTALLVCSAAAAATLVGGLVVVLSKKVDNRLLAFGFSFAAGAMVYVSLVEILAKGRDSFAELMPDAEAYRLVTFWFFVGTLLVVLFEQLLPKTDENAYADPEEDRRRVGRAGVLAALAIGAHNFPEGAATFFATLNDPSLGLKLGAAIAIHNIPEGVSVAVPLLYATGSRSKAMLGTAITALAEPIGGLLAWLVLGPWLDAYVFGIVFGIIAGSMVFLSLHELMPSAKRYAQGRETVYGLVGGMAVLALSLVILK